MLLRSALSLALSIGLPLGNTAEVRSPAGQEEVDQGAAAKRIFEEWVTAFNSGDPANITAFYDRYLGDKNPVFALESAQDTCGFDLERIEAISATTMTALLRQRCLPGLQRARLEVAADGVKLKSLRFRPLPLPGDGSIIATAMIADRLSARNDFAGSIIIARHGKRLLARSWGFADPATRSPMTLDTPMFLASAGKMFTAIAIFQLVDAGKVELDAPLGKYLTDYQNAATAKVTIRQLLTHRGGTGDIGILGRDDGANRAHVRTIDDIIKLNSNRAPDFPPGSQDAYSNYGFILLGAIIEKITGDSYYDYVAEHVFKPAGMKNSGFPDRDHLQGVGVGYTTFFGAEPKLVPNTGILPWRGASAGGGVSTPNDMVRFLRAVKDGKLLSPAMFKLATAAGPTPGFGMGFVVNTGEAASFGHGGNSYGMDVAAHHFINGDTTFVCMATRDMACTRLITAWALRTFGAAQ